MKSKLKLIRAAWLRAALLAVLVALISIVQATEAPDLAEAAAPKTAAPIPWSEIGTKTGADYRGDGLSVMTAPNGAQLCCVFQRLEGGATSEGLWLVSTVTNAANERFRVTACSVGRTAAEPACLSPTGTVEVKDTLARFVRRGLTEEYSVSMDGVRQDFVVLERPAGAGDLAVRLAVSGAKVGPMAFGAQLVLDYSGRKIAYSRLRVTDATGKELTARMEIEVGTRDVTSPLPPNRTGGFPASGSPVGECPPDLLQSFMRGWLAWPGLRRLGRLTRVPRSRRLGSVDDPILGRDLCGAPACAGCSAAAYAAICPVRCRDSRCRRRSTRPSPAAAGSVRR